MRLMSTLVSRYISCREGFNCRANYLLLQRLADNMLSVGEHMPVLEKITADDNVFMTEELFLELTEEYGLLQKFGSDSINEELLDRIILWEYQSGCYDSAREFLYYSPDWAEKNGFEHRIEYNDKWDDYYIRTSSDTVLSGEELESICTGFLEKLE